MSGCPTRSGPYQCKHEVDATGRHAGDCEADDASTPANTIGDRARASQHLRGILDRASGAGLDTMGKALGVERESCEPDSRYRERIWAVR